MTDEEFHKAMKELCASRWVTQRFVAHAIGVRSGSVARWAAGKGLPQDPRHRDHIQLLHKQLKSWHFRTLPFLLTDYTRAVAYEDADPSGFFVRATASASEREDALFELIAGASFDTLTFTMRSLFSDLSADGKTWSSDLRFGPVTAGSKVVIHVKNAARARKDSLSGPRGAPAWRS